MRFDCGRFGRLTGVDGNMHLNRGAGKLGDFLFDDFTVVFSRDFIELKFHRWRVLKVEAGAGPRGDSGVGEKRAEGRTVLVELF